MKHINAITIILVIVAVVFVGVLIFAPGIIGLQSSDEKYISAYFDPDTVNTVSITISEEDWADMLENPTAEEYHEATIEINGDTYEGVGIRTKGMTSLSQVASSDSNRYSFKVKSDEYLGGQSFLGLNKFVLNNNYQDASYMKEYLSYQLLTELGVPTPAYAYAAIYINGEYWGLYLMVEAVEEDFAARNFGMNYGQLYKPESMNMDGGGGGHDIDKKDDNNNRNMTQMMEEFNKLTDEEKEDLLKNIKGGNFPGMLGQTTQPTGDGTVPTMPDGMTQPTGDGTAPTMPDGMTQPTGDGTAPTMPDGMTQPTGDGTAPTMPDGDGGNFPSMPSGDFGGFGGSGGGCDLVYTDDNIDSYSQIFDNAVFSNVTTDDKNRVITALKNLKEGTDLEEYINVDEVLRYFAVNTALVNLDSYVSSLKHNYYLYEEDGQLSMLPWDYNLAFGAFQSGSSSNIINFPIDTPVSQGIELSERPMIGSLLAVDSYKDTYHEYLQKIATEFFGDSYEERINKIDAMISSYVETDPTAFYTYDQYKSGIEYLKVYGELRAQSILGQINGTIPSTWDGQTADSSSLIDASELSNYSSGGFGGGGGFGGDFGGGGNNKPTDRGNGGGGNKPATAT